MSKYFFFSFRVKEVFLFVFTFCIVVYKLYAFNIYFGIFHKIVIILSRILIELGQH